MAEADKNRPTKQERREAAREEARRIREEQARREKRNRTLVIGGVVLGVLVVIAVVWAVLSRGSVSALDGVDSPAGSTQKGGIPVGASLAAGTTNEGDDVLDVYFDYTCSYCNIFEELNAQDVQTIAQDGLATVVFHPVAILDRSGDFSGYSGLAANAAATVAQHAPEEFLAFHDALFDPWSEASKAAQEAGATTIENPPGLAEIEEVALAAGVPQDVVDRFADGEFRSWVEATTRQMGLDGLDHTPSIFLDGIDGEEFTDWSTPGSLLAAAKEQFGG